MLGKAEMHGHALQNTFSRAAGDVLADSTTIHMQSYVGDWRVGDRLSFPIRGKRIRSTDRIITSTSRKRKRPPSLPSRQTPLSWINHCCLITWARVTPTARPRKQPTALLWHLTLLT